MRNRKSGSNISWSDEWKAATLLSLSWRMEQARLNPSDFVEVWFTGPEGGPLRQGRVHRELQDFLTQNRRALVELLRDHGKSVQVCLRILWELGRNPALRVRVVC